MAQNSGKKLKTSTSIIASSSKWIKFLPEIFALILFCTALALAIRQQIVSTDKWLNLHQIWHHETLIAVFVFGGVCLIIGKYLGKR